ncbi:MAG: sigma 54-interacting transcriptional regulator [Acidaminobacteraceae bacterium]
MNSKSKLIDNLDSKLIDNEINLENICENLESIAVAIGSALNVDVTIMDSNLTRLVGTGRYRKEIGCTIDDRSVFSAVLNTGMPIVIANPRENSACDQCKDREKCVEYAQACCPIIHEGNVVGIIGLIAFDENTRDQIVQNEGNLIKFLKKMADLIALNLIEQKQNILLNKKSQELQIIINAMDHSIISLDKNHKIINCNINAEKNLKVGIGMSINELNNFDIRKIEKHFGKIKDTYAINYEYNDDGKFVRYVFDVKPVVFEGKVSELVLIFTKVNALINVVNDAIKSKSISSFEEIIGESKEICKTIEIAKKSAQSSSTVLILGESGTGKELFARAIHSYSSRAKQPFVAINCAAIPENLLESELFGYEEGTFTGAIKGGKLGKFELANKGTIFLDELGDMQLHIQSKLLRVLQEKEVERLGSKYPISVDIRVIAATNKNIEEMVKNGEFREDLFYRLNVIPLYIPSLIERSGDIEILTKHFIKKYNKKLSKEIKNADISVINLFNEYKWKGNIRELENTIEYCVNMCVNDIISISDLPIRFSEFVKKSKKNTASQVVSYKQKEENEKLILLTNLKELENREIRKAINLYGREKDGINRIVKELGVSRATLYRKLNEYGI